MKSNSSMFFVTTLFLLLATLFSTATPVLAGENYANSKGTYYLPFKRGKIVSVTRAGAAHALAVDFAVGAGTPIYSSRDGVIKQIIEKNTKSGCIESYAKYNNQVVIYDKNTGESQYYLHLSTNSVPNNLKVGQYIPAGTFIGKSGAIGYVCGAHLHFHVSKNGVRVNPKFSDVSSGFVASGKKYKSGNPYPFILANKFLDSGLWSSAYGENGDLFFTGDFDGNGNGDFITATPRLNLDNNPVTNDLAWYVMKSNGTALIDAGRVADSWGLAEDRFFVGDFNGDGKDDVIVATSRLNLDNDPATNDLAWFVMKSNGLAFVDAGQVTASWGVAEDQFFVGDFDGDKKADVIAATSRLNLDNNPATNDLAWYVMKSNGSAFVDAGRVVDSWGWVEDKFFMGDFNGDGKDDVINATARLNLDNDPATNDSAWYVMKSNGVIFVDAGQVAASWGWISDNLFVADFDGDGKDDILDATTRLNNDGSLSWYVATSDGNQAFIDKGIWASRWGLSGDVILIHNYRNSDNTNTKNFDVMAGRVVSTAYQWWVMYADR